MRIFVSFFLLSLIVQVRAQDVLVVDGAPRTRIQIVDINEEVMTYLVVDSPASDTVSILLAEVDQIKAGAVGYYSSTFGSAAGEDATTTSFGELRRRSGLFTHSYYDGLFRVDRSTFVAKLKSSPLRARLHNRSIATTVVSSVIGIPCGFVLGNYLGRWVAGDSAPSGRLFVYSAVGTGISLILDAIADGKMRRVINHFNRYQIAGLSIGSGEYGTGLVLAF